MLNRPNRRYSDMDYDGTDRRQAPYCNSFDEAKIIDIIKTVIHAETVNHVQPSSPPFLNFNSLIKGVMPLIYILGGLVTIYLTINNDILILKNKFESFTGKYEEEVIRRTKNEEEFQKKLTIIDEKIRGQEDTLISLYQSSTRKK